MADQSKDNRRVVYHVTPDASAERWVVSREDSDFRRDLDTKQQAETFAKQTSSV